MFRLGILSGEGPEIERYRERERKENRGDRRVREKRWRMCSSLHGRLSWDLGGGGVSLRVSVLRHSEVMQMLRQAEGKAE